MLLLLPLNEGFVCCGEVGTRFKQEKADFVKFWEVQFIPSDTVMLKGPNAMKGLCRCLTCSVSFSTFLSVASLLLGARSRLSWKEKKSRRSFLKMANPQAKVLSRQPF